MSGRKQRTGYRKLSFITDIRGIKSAIGELRGVGYPKQPKLNKDYRRKDSDPVFNEQWFIDIIEDKFARHPENSLEFPFEGEKIYDKPLVGFVRGDDPIFKQYKSVIGPHHFTPEEIMAWQAKKNNVPAPPAEALSVVSIVMPIVKDTKDANAAQTEWPSERWAQTRLLGEIFSQTYVREIVTQLMDGGVLAIAPDVTPMFNKKRYPNVGWASPWSHRHIAYAAGLGAFGVHDFFITEKGAAHRVASFVVNLKLEPNRTKPADIHANCLHHQGIKCLKCASRCPVGAITELGHDKEKCYQKVASTIKYCNKNYHIFIYGCGLCATGVPCESQIPKAIKQKVGCD